VDNTVYEPIRSARQSTIIRLVATHFTLTAVINLVFFAGNTFRPLASATGGLLTGSLLANLTFIGVLVGVVIMRWGGLRLYDLGVISGQIPKAILYTFGFWGLAQIIHLIAGLLYYGHVVISPDWNNPQFLIGLILTQIIGNALFEEIAYRGFLFPQLFLRFAALEDRPWGRLALAIILSQGVFALSHIPNRIYLGMTPNEIALDLLMLLGWGTLYTLIYLKTDNLFVVVGVHALGNAPTTLFASAPLLSGAGASILIYTLVVIVLFGWPLLRAHRERMWRQLVAET
jgi:CAAX protease family protein